MVLFTLALVIGGLLGALKVYTRLIVGRCTSKRNLASKVAIVTGSNVGIGLETVKELLMRNARVIMACRSLDKGRAALEVAIRETGCDPKQVTLKQLDLSSLASVRRFAAEIIAEESRLDILVNNAGAATTTKVLTEDGLETNFAANHFGPFLLTNLLLGLMKRTPSPGEARIVNVSADVYRMVKELDLDNLNSEKWFGHPIMLYARTKLANVLFTQELNRRMKAAGILNVVVNALHPGAVQSELNRSVTEAWYMKIFFTLARATWHKTTEEGAQTSVHLAVAAELDGVSGGYFMDCAPAKVTGLAKDDELARKLWEASVRMVKLQPEESIVYKKGN